MARDRWTLRSFSWRDPDHEYARQSFPDETLARKAFEAACVHAREHGGGYELLCDGVSVARFSCADPKGGSGS